MCYQITTSQIQYVRNINPTQKVSQKVIIEGSLGDMYKLFSGLEMLRNRLKVRVKKRKYFFINIL